MPASSITNSPVFLYLVLILLWLGSLVAFLIRIMFSSAQIADIQRPRHSHPVRHVDLESQRETVSRFMRKVD